MVCDFLNGQYNTGMAISLNPYSIGIWSATRRIKFLQTNMYRLNPYSIGIWSATHVTTPNIEKSRVLILILLEYGLRPGRKC